jgi:dUTP pyrophosphatase
MDQQNFSSFLNKLTTETNHKKAMVLIVFVDSDDSVLKNMYIDAANNHNNKIMNDPYYYDAGFDLFLPKDDTNVGTKFFASKTNFHVNKVDFKVKCSALIIKDDLTHTYTPFYTYARSSISKTPLRLANNQGIIDAGYRGSLIGMFDCIFKDTNNVECDYYVEPYTRLLQVCAPSLMPVYVRIVNTIDELGGPTSRGSGGFGSTGK